jgi:hypothetical protein
LAVDCVDAQLNVSWLRRGEIDPLDAVSTARAVVKSVAWSLRDLNLHVQVVLLNLEEHRHTAADGNSMLPQ